MRLLLACLCGRAVARGAIARALYRRHLGVPGTLVLASAYAGWGGSLPAEEAEWRLRHALELAELSGGDPGLDAGNAAGVGHACNVDAPEAFNQAVRGFLDGLGARR